MGIYSTQPTPTPTPTHTYTHHTPDHIQHTITNHIDHSTESVEERIDHSSENIEESIDQLEENIDRSSESAECLEEEENEYACNKIESEYFIESLRIKSVLDNLFLFDFNFTTTLDIHLDSFFFDDFNLFPKSIGRLIREHQVLEFDLMFTQGRWQYQDWGRLDYPSPSGVELVGRFYPDADIENESEHWNAFTRGLGGLFCASLEFLDDKTTGKPSFAFPAKSDIFSPYMRHGILPREAVCTENITPWIKLLPCSSKYGIAQLLWRPRFLYDSQYHSMGVHLKTVCKNEKCDEVTLVLEQSISVLKDNIVKSKKKGMSIEGLFETDILPCPLSSSSIVSISAAEYEISSNHEVHHSDKESVVFDLWKDPETPFTLQATASTQHTNKHHVEKSGVSLSRFISGYGQQYGSIVIVISNTLQEDTEVSIYQNTPWFIRIMHHTSTVQIDGNEISLDKALKMFNFSPAEERASPSSLEFLATIPASSTLTFTIKFYKAFLHWKEYPPDAHKGFDIGPCIMTVGATGLHHTEKIYSEGINVELATPDFSMPYNVIIFTCTCASLFFGSLVTTLTIRHKQIHAEGREFISTRPIPSLLRSVTKAIDRITMKF